MAQKKKPADDGAADLNKIREILFGEQETVLDSKFSHLPAIGKAQDAGGSFP